MFAFSGFARVLGEDGERGADKVKKVSPGTEI